jgi:DNA-binding MarR family transcriptional regulator
MLYFHLETMGGRFIMTDASTNDLQKIKERIQKSLFQILANEFDNDVEKKRLVERISNPELKRLAPHLSILSLHTLEVISEKEGIKGIDIAKELNVTKSAISKTTRKLLDQGLIKKEQRPTNLKEIYYYVTPLGAELSELHRQLHREKDRKAFDLLRSYDQKSLEIIADFIEKMARLG